MDSSILAFIGAFSVIILIVGIIWYVLGAIACMKMFTKANEAGWKGWIPILNTYTIYSICWEGKFFWIWFVLRIVEAYTVNSQNTVVAVLNAVAMICATVINLIRSLRLSKSFGHGVGFGIGLLFLEPIFLLILGFGKSQYVGKPEGKLV